MHPLKTQKKGKENPRKKPRATPPKRKRGIYIIAV
jgi:hypothetical protein